jgi:hypothetical protein
MRKGWKRCGGPTRPRPASPGGADGPGRRVAGRTSPAGRRAGLSRQGPDRDARAVAGPALCHRAQDHGRGAVRGKGTRPGHAQLHRRRRHLHGRLWEISPSSIPSRKNDRLVVRKKRRAGPWPRFFGSWTPRLAKPPIRWRWRSGQIAGHLPSNCVLVRRDGFEIPIEDSVAPIHDREGSDRSGGRVPRRERARAMALQMTHSAEHDFLTGLPNRMLLNDRIGQAIAWRRVTQKSRGAVPGFGRLQAHQRFPGTSGRRQASSIRRQAPGGLRARARTR